MRISFTAGMLALAAVPAAAYSCPTGPASSCWGMSTALMGAVAALGFWVLKQAGKNKDAVAIAGRVTGWTLLVLGLLGFLCGSSYHMLRPQACGTRTVSHSETMLLDALPPGHPPMDEKKQ